jgi:hypothetical protein
MICCQSKVTKSMIIVATIFCGQLKRKPRMQTLYARPAGSNQIALSMFAFATAATTPPISPETGTISQSRNAASNAFSVAFPLLPRKRKKKGENAR